ncbi:MAG: type I methionyl aminopeptidase [Chloroflexota bacterium]
MSVTIKSPREVEFMRVAGQIVANALVALREAVEPGMTTKELDRIAERSIRRQGAEPAFPYINDFPGTVCTSVNDEVVHGIPGKRVLRGGDIVKLDVGAIYQGYHGDAAITVPVGQISQEAERLVNVTDQALAMGIMAARGGGFLHDIGGAIQEYVDPTGFSIVRQYVGHGVGRELHEDPTVPHYRQPTRGIRLRAGMMLTIEPMINAGTYETALLSDKWTVVTKDKKLSAQFEHTVLITDNEAEIVTLPETGEGWGIPMQVADRVY